MERQADAEQQAVMPSRNGRRYELSTSIFYQNFRSRVRKSAHLSDLSTNGCNILTFDPMQVGDTIVLWIKGVGSRAAQVRWVGPGSLGICFVQPIDPWVVEQYAKSFAPLEQQG